jgi:3-oxoacyl-[acyl-carrier-protein] synthase-3
LALNIAIESVAYELPPHIITSLEIERQIEKTLERLSIPVGNLERLTGIRERRFWDPGTMPSDVATSAARAAIESAGIDQGEIGCVISTSVSKDYIEPSVASLVHGNLGLSSHCRSYDIGNACLGFLDAIDTIGLMINDGRFDYGLVVNGECAREPVEATIDRLKDPDTSMSELKENFATLTIGSGSAAMILASRDRSKSGHVVNGSMSLADSKNNRLCIAQRDQGWTDAHGMFVAGVELAVTAWKLGKERFEGWGDESIDLYIPHQVSVRHTNAIIEALSLTPEKVIVNVETTGNVGPAAIPIVLGVAEESGRVKRGDHIVLLGIGSGLNCMGMSVSW